MLITSNDSSIHISIDASFRSLCPNFYGAAICAEVVNSPSSPALWEEIAQYEQQICDQFTTETIKDRSGIAATRLAYKAFGKDPSRYRPACEQLARRVLQGKGLYKVNTIVDLVNLVSLASGYSTAALDADKISGTQITLGIGGANEPYEAIGRGTLNIEHLPAYRDELGAFATPTSDSTRTMTSLNTTRLLVIINGYDGDHEAVKRASQLTIDLLEKYAHATKYEATFYEHKSSPIPHSFCTTIRHPNRNQGNSNV